MKKTPSKPEQTKHECLTQQVTKKTCSTVIIKYSVTTVTLQKSNIWQNHPLCKVCTFIYLSAMVIFTAMLGKRLLFRNT